VIVRLGNHPTKVTFVFRLFEFLDLVVELDS